MSFSGVIFWILALGISMHIIFGTKKNWSIFLAVNLILLENMNDDFLLSIFPLLINLYLLKTTFPTRKISIRLKSMMALVALPFIILFGRYFNEIKKVSLSLGYGASVFSIILCVLLYFELSRKKYGTRVNH